VNNTFGIKWCLAITHRQTQSFSFISFNALEHEKDTGHVGVMFTILVYVEQICVEIHHVILGVEMVDWYAARPG
jgi:hypothetical protein